MKKDLLIAVAAIAVIAVLCFALNAMRLPLPPTASEPYRAPLAEQGTKPAVSSHVVMRVNGEAVTEEEFDVAFKQLPQEVQQQFANEQGKQALAERIVRLKILEQEGRKKGVDGDAKVAAQVAVSRTNAIADAMFAKLQTPAKPAEVQKFYEENRAKLESVALSHILIAFQGGEAPPRDGVPLTQEQALQKARQIHQRLQQGADFAQVAKQFSDDTGSAERGGSLGDVARGMLPPELDKIVFELPVGQVSNPVTSRYGIHIFKVTKKQGEPNEQVRGMIAQRVAQQDAMQKIEELRKTAKVDFDPKFFPLSKAPQQPAPAMKKAS
jgi:peptidyl-prolyl cis-trans isomerase C